MYTFYEITKLPKILQLYKTFGFRSNFQIKLRVKNTAKNHLLLRTRSTIAIFVS